MASHSWGVGMRSPQQDDKRRFYYLVISTAFAPRQNTTARAVEIGASNNPSPAAFFRQPAQESHRSGLAPCAVNATHSNKREHIMNRSRGSGIAGLMLLLVSGNDR